MFTPLRMAEKSREHPAVCSRMIKCRVSEAGWLGTGPPPLVGKPSGSRREEHTRLPEQEKPCGRSNCLKNTKPG